MCVCVCVCVCVRERGRERERQTECVCVTERQRDRETDRQTDRQTVGGNPSGFQHSKNIVPSAQNWARGTNIKEHAGVSGCLLLECT